MKTFSRSHARSSIKGKYTWMSTAQPLFSFSQKQRNDAVTSHLTFAKKMNPIREISMTMMKAAIITVAVVLGFCAGSALGLPVWLQGVFIIPAMLLFYRLSDQRRPPIWKMIGFVGLLSIFVLLVSLGSKYVPDQDFWYYYMLILLIAPFGPILNWFERRFFPKEHKIGPDGASNDG